ncbi:hypothetical protein ACQP1O_30515 [Nocardia sp. CA-151230]|uniref:hypothetical protein n=1 Tax=Nocardia sp. CA-151230 TaxID=3239982 RepID=UPI003D9075D5
MYPSHPMAPEGPRHTGQQMAPGVLPGQPPWMTQVNPGGKHSAIASFVTYAKALEALDRRSFPDEYAEYADRIRELEPFLRAHGILDVMDIKNPEIAALIGV